MSFLPRARRVAGRMLKSFSLSSIYSRLVLLLLVVLGPAILFAAWANSASHDQTIQQIRSDLVKQAHAVVLEEERLLDSARETLIVIARSVAIDGVGSPKVADIVKSLMGNYPQYANVGFADLSGQVRLSAAPLTKPVSIADREYFLHALRSGQFSVGQFQVGRITGRHSVNFGYPVVAPDGRTVGVAFAAVDIEWLNRFDSELVADLPPRSIVLEIDTSATILAHWPDPESWVGRSLPDETLVKTILTRHNGVQRMTGLDGTERLFAFTSVRSEMFNGTIYVAVGIPYNEVLERANSLSYSNVRYFILFMAVAFVLFWVGAELLILRQAKALLRTAERLKENDFSARTGLSYTGGELGDIARALDTAAEAIERYSADARRTGEQLRESERRYRELAEFLPEVIYETDRQGNLLYVNRRAFELFGYRADELARLPNVLDMLAPQDRERARRDLEAVLEAGSYERGEYLGRKSDGSLFPLAVYSSPVRMAGRIEGIRGILIDISEQKRAEQEHRENEERLRQFQKMEAIGQLAGGVAHDFNNMLTAIQGNLELALMDLRNDLHVTGYLEQVREIGRRAAKLTNKLLLFSRRAPMKLTPINLNRTVESISQMLTRLLGDQVEIVTHYGPDLWTINADEGNIEQVLMNLVLNARDAMPNGGVVAIETRNLAPDATTDAVDAFGPNTVRRSIGRREDPFADLTRRFVGVAVTDRGGGMPAWVVERLFEPFFTTKPRGAGTGLGLSVVYGIVREHQGWIEVTSTEGEGSRFEIAFPATDGVVTEVAKEPKVDRTFGGGQRILVVEDEPDILSFLDSGLTACGYRVTTAASAEEALARYRQEDGRFDVLVSDVVLPRMSGIELAKELHALDPELPCVLASGYLDDRMKGSGFDEARCRFLPKPFALLELLRVISEISTKS